MRYCLGLERLCSPRSFRTNASDCQLRVGAFFFFCFVCCFFLFFCCNCISIIAQEDDVDDDGNDDDDDEEDDDDGDDADGDDDGEDAAAADDDADDDDDDADDDDDDDDADDDGGDDDDDDAAFISSVSLRGDASRMMMSMLAPGTSEGVELTKTGQSWRKLPVHRISHMNPVGLDFRRPPIQGWLTPVRADGFIARV
jgi:hypothetical protein